MSTGGHWILIAPDAHDRNLLRERPAPTRAEREAEEHLIRAEHALAAIRRLDDLMLRCREDRHELTYDDLVAVKGGA